MSPAAIRYEDFETIQRELAAFSADLAAKPQIVVATKMDAVGDAEAVDALEAHVAAHDLPFLRISAVTGEGLAELQEAVWRYLTPIEAVARRGARTVDSTEAERGRSEAEVVARRAGARRDPKK